MSNKKVMVVVVILIMLAIISGCTTKEVTPQTATPGETPTITSVATPNGQTQTSIGNAGSSWCQTGTNITTTTTTGQGYFVVKGMTIYKGNDVCEADYNYNQGSITYYFTENSKYFVMIYKDTSGKTLSETSNNP